MMKEKDIRSFLPFFVVFISTFFLSEANLFQVFPPAIKEIAGNVKLKILSIGADVFQAMVWLPCCLIFFKAWRILRGRNLWYTDILWQISGVFFCWFILALVRIWGVYHLYLWIQGLVSFFVAIFGLYFFNTLYAARKLIYYPQTSEEAQLKAEKFDKMIKYLKENAGK
jgi:hypothetical protein